MPRGEIIIEEKLCQGCGYCIKFCTRDCIREDKQRVSPGGNLLPLFAFPEKCTACGICAWMCPPCAIEVYRYVE